MIGAPRPVKRRAAGLDRQSDGRLAPRGRGLSAGDVTTAPATGPALPRSLGPAGLLPQMAALAVVAFAPVEWSFAGVTGAQFYAAAILSFLGGIWWGIATGAERAPGWLWIAAVLPSLWAAGWLFTLQWGWNRAVLLGLGSGLLAALAVDRALLRLELMPRWLWHLRVRLSVWLAILTGAIALIGPMS